MSNPQEVTAPASNHDSQVSYVTPDVDIVEDESGITLYADVPGVSKEHLQIRVHADNLFLEGTAVVAAPQDLELLYSEVRHPRYRRTFTLSRELDSNHIAASLIDGVLKLRIPKLEAARPRRIEVKVG
ncbi:MAG: Hsp20/alpha crystallin family protein [Burkholderiaceae bacterium]